MSPVDLANLRVRREAVVRDHIEAEAVQHDVAATIATFKRPRYEVPALGGVFEGVEGLEELLRNLLEGFPDFWVKESRRHHADNAVIVECILGGTHRGAFAGVAPTERPIQVQAVLVFEFDEDALICERVYFDLATIFRQLGVIA